MTVLFTGSAPPEVAPSFNHLLQHYAYHYALGVISVACSGAEGHNGRPASSGGTRQRRSRRNRPWNDGRADRRASARGGVPGGGTGRSERTCQRAEGPRRG